LAGVGELRVKKPLLSALKLSMIRIFKASSKYLGQRLDHFLSERLTNLSRSYIQRLIAEGHVQVNGECKKPSYRLKSGEQIEITLPTPKAIDIIPEPMPLNILYEDSDIMVIDKPAGLVVHPAPGHWTSTLVHGLLAYLRHLSSIGGCLRPGIVHRLDKDTSGVLLVTKNDTAHKDISRQFKDGMVYKRYEALVYGMVKEDEGNIIVPIGRHPKDRKRISVHTRYPRIAKTEWRVQKRFPDLTLLDLILKTGRTHQARVHLSAKGHPVVGDPVYARKKRLTSISNLKVREILKNVNRQLLHAHVLGLRHPRTKNYIEFTAPLPEDMKQVIEAIEKVYC